MAEALAWLKERKMITVTKASEEKTMYVSLTALTMLMSKENLPEFFLSLHNELKQIEVFNRVGKAQK